MAVFGVLYAKKAIRRERVFKDPLDPLAISDKDLLRLYRFPRREILEITEDLKPYLESPTRRGHDIPAVIQVLAAIRFYSSGASQNAIAHAVGVHQSSVSKIIENVTHLLTFKALQEIQMPETAVERIETMEDFENIQKFPRVIGAVGCTHIPIKLPSNEGIIYINNKGYTSMNVQAICNAKHEILDFNARFPGETEYDYIWFMSFTRTRFENGEFGDSVLIADSSYPLEPFLMTPVEEPITAAEHRYNGSLRQSRVVVDQCFRILKSRFRCLHKSGGALQYEPGKCAHIVVACFLLHNYCIRGNFPNPDEDNMSQGYHQEQQDVAEQRIIQDSNPGINMRKKLIKKYFS